MFACVFLQTTAEITQQSVVQAQLRVTEFGPKGFMPCKTGQNKDCLLQGAGDQPPIAKLQKGPSPVVKMRRFGFAASAHERSQPGLLAALPPYEPSGRACSCQAASLLLASRLVYVLIV